MKVINSWFAKMEVFLRECNVLDMPDLSSRLWNADETAFCTAVASPKVLARRGSRCVYKTAGGSGRDYITVIRAGAADGVRLPPYTLYGTSKSGWMEASNFLVWFTLYGASKSGWMEASNFLEWFTKMILPAVTTCFALGTWSCSWVDTTPMFHFH